jgi:general stress protein 26
MAASSGMNISSFSGNEDRERSGKPDTSRTAHLIRLATQVINSHRPGVLATVGSSGEPNMRWMGTLSLRNFPHLYALTSPTSRKVTEIYENPRVTWMFTSEQAVTVLKLKGTATVITDEVEVQQIWPLIDDKSMAYFLSLDSGEDVAVIDTVIERIECVIPKYGMHYATVDYEEWTGLL